MDRLSKTMQKATGEYAEGGSFAKFAVKYYACFVAGMVVVSLPRRS